MKSQLWLKLLFIILFLGLPRFFYATNSDSYSQKVAKTAETHIHNLCTALSKRQKDDATKNLEELTAIFKELDWQSETIEQCIVYIQEQVQADHFENAGNLLTILFDALHHPTELFKLLEDAVLKIMQGHKEQKKFEDFKQELVDIYVEYSQRNEIEELKKNLVSKINENFKKKEFEPLIGTLLNIVDTNKGQPLALIDGFNRELEGYKKWLQSENIKSISLLKDNLNSMYEELKLSYVMSDEYKTSFETPLILLGWLEKKPEDSSNYFNNAGWWNYFISPFINSFTLKEVEHIPSKIIALKEDFSKSVCSILAHQAKVKLQNDIKNEGIKNKLCLENFLKEIEGLKASSRYDSAELSMIWYRWSQGVLDTFNLKKHVGRVILPITGFASTMVKSGQDYTKKIPTMIPRISDQIPTQMCQESISEIEKIIQEEFSKRPLVIGARNIGLYRFASPISLLVAILKKEGILGIPASTLRYFAGKHLKPLDEQIKNNVPVGEIFLTLRNLINTFGVGPIVQFTLGYIEKNNETIDKKIAGIVSGYLIALQELLQDLENNVKTKTRTVEQKIIDVGSLTLENINNVLENAEDGLEILSRQSSISTLGITDKVNFFNKNPWSSSWEQHKKEEIKKITIRGPCSELIADLIKEKKRKEEEKWAIRPYTGLNPRFIAELIGNKKKEREEFKMRRIKEYVYSRKNNILY
jgi:hypothetical protein